MANKLKILHFYDATVNTHSSFFPYSIKEAVTFINEIDVNKFSRLISRIIQKLHLKVQRLHSVIRAKDKRLLRLLQQSSSARESSACIMTLLELEHQSVGL